MVYKSETEIMKVLQIDSWQNLSKGKVLDFVGLLPQIDKELAIRIVEQFPEFRQFAADALEVLEDQHSSTLASNKDSQAQVHRAFQDVRAILANELKRDDLSPSDRMVIIEKIMDTANREFEKDSENKRFLDTLFGKAAMATAATLALGAAVLGGRLLADDDKDLNEGEDRRA